MKIRDRVLKRARNLKRLSDVELVELAKADDKDAFGELYERYLEKIYNYVFYRTGNHHDAEDLTARVFFRAMAHIQTYTERGVPFQAWLYRIAHNLVANWHRDSGRRKIIPLDEYVAGSLRSESPDHHAEDKQ
ncbi:MAG: sigma-70 family RNA polymerase sigma factor, partial [Anaerolineae bacterium]|nr:sigma-70 family RNA polymerase sigma factor [Anaerolineae bacterium]